MYYSRNARIRRAVAVYREIFNGDEMDVNLFNTVQWQDDFYPELKEGAYTLNELEDLLFIWFEARKDSKSCTAKLSPEAISWCKEYKWNLEETTAEKEQEEKEIKIITEAMNGLDKSTIQLLEKYFRNEMDYYIDLY